VLQSRDGGDGHGRGLFKVMLSGFMASEPFSATLTYCAKAPSRPPKHFIAGLKRVTFFPTDSTVPAKSTPM